MTAADCFRIVAAREQVPAYDLEHAMVYFRNLSPKLNESDLKLRLAHLRPMTARLVAVLLEAREQCK